MTKKIILLSMVYLIAFSGFSQYDYKQQGKSVVQVWVDIPGSEPSVCTGFVWKHNNWVVTSLHAMHPNGKVKVLYGDFWNTNVKVIKVHEKADLVLLEVGEPAKFPASVVPIMTAKTTTINYEEGLSSIGYNMGARSAQPKSLKRGASMKKETLYNTLPPDVVTKLQSFKVPDVHIEIMMIEGSLLPGYSGSPIFHKADGSLVAIGDGGLDAGTKNVSWAIPAKYLVELEDSQVTKVPSGLESSPLHFTSKVAIKSEAIAEKVTAEPETEEYFEEIYELYAEEYAGITNGDFEFYYVKTRTYKELYSTSFDTENLDKITEIFTSLGLGLDYELFSYDIYEDPYNEIIIVLPEGSVLYVDETNNFKADIGGLPMSDFFQLSFLSEPNNNLDWENAMYALQDKMNNEELGLNIEGWLIDPEFNYSYELDEYASMGWELFYGEQPYIAEYLDDDEQPTSDTLYIYSYITLLTDKINEKRFSSNAILSMPTIAFEYMEPEVILDCINNYSEEEEACDYFETWMKVVIASHMTSFSFVQYAENEGDYDEYYEE